MKTQDFVCPYCHRTVTARETQPPQKGNYYFVGLSWAVVKIQGYHWIQPYPHRAEDYSCPGAKRRYYVGDANL